MHDLNAALAGTRAAVQELIAAGERSGAAWKTPRAPGKWSPSQVVEHVARALEESANQAAEAPSKFPTFPAFVRPLVRVLFFNRVLRTSNFPRGRTAKTLDPPSGPATPAAGRMRLEVAFGRFEHECRARAASARRVNSTIFGAVAVEDFARFQELHVRHHRKQIPDA